jgi:hypothetical protein
MIVRISGEDQYRLDDSESAGLEALESAVTAAEQIADESAFRAALTALLDFVRANGTVVGDDELETSDVILPPADVTLEEAVSEFSGEGLIPD